MEQLKVVVLTRPDGIPVECIQGSPRECVSVAAAVSAVYGSLRPLEDIYLKRVLRVHAEYGTTHFVVVVLNGGDMLLCVAAPKAVPLGRLHVLVRLLEEELSHNPAKRI